MLARRHTHTYTNSSLLQGTFVLCLLQLHSTGIQKQDTLNALDFDFFFQYKKYLCTYTEPGTLSCQLCWSRIFVFQPVKRWVHYFPVLYPCPSPKGLLFYHLHCVTFFLLHCDIYNPSVIMLQMGIY